MKVPCTLFALLFTSLFLHAQTVSTVSQGSFSDGLGIDSQGNIYGSDYGGDSVYKYDVTSGTVTTFQSGFTNPNGIGVSPQDEVYVCEANGGTIHKYDTNGNVLDTFTGLNNPTGIKYDPVNEIMLWVSYNESSIYELDLNTGQSTLIQDGLPLNGPSGIAFINGERFISNFNDRKIFRLELDDSLTEIAQLPSLGPPSLNFCGFLSAKDGKLIATHIGGHQVFSIDPSTGEVVSIAGSTQGSNDGPIGSATFFRPNGILGDEANNIIYVTDGGTRNLRIIEDITLNTDTVFMDAFSLELYPNPARDTLTISSKNAGSKYDLKVFDVSGKLIQKKEIKLHGTAFSEVIDVASLPSGTYLIEVSNGNEKVTKKFIK